MKNLIGAMTASEIIGLEKTLNQLAQRYRSEGAKIVMGAIKRELIDDKSPRDGSLGDDYWKGYDDALKAAHKLSQEISLPGNSKLK